MQNLVPHLWFDTQAKEAAALYTSVFADSEITNVRTITGTPSGDCDIVRFTLANQEFMAISAGPHFKLNPAISLFVVFDSESEIEAAWHKLSEGGKPLMPYDSYPWASKYGWLQDKYGLSWQLSWSAYHEFQQKITPLLMFTKGRAGKAREAIQTYTGIFPNSTVAMVAPYAKGEGDTEGFVKHARFTLDGRTFMAMDSSGPHDFTFNEAISFIVSCDTQEQIDYYWGKLSAVPAAEQCGWLKDKYGVSWQIVPSAMNRMLTTGSKEQVKRVTQAFLKKKKFDIQALKHAYKQS